MRLSTVLMALSLAPVLGGCAYQQSAPARTDILSITVGDVPLLVELADTDSERAQGLSGRESLAQGAGMLFVFESPGQYEFWMKDMMFPLDFLWISNGAVADVSQNVPAPSLRQSEPARVRPGLPVTGVIEVPAGWIEENGVNVGNVVDGLP